MKQLQEERQQQIQQQPVDNTTKSPGQQRRRPSNNTTTTTTSASSPIQIPASSSQKQNNQQPAVIVAASPSKTVQEIDQIRQAREERRAAQAEFKRIKDGLEDGEEYRFLIDKFREQLSIATEGKPVEYTTSDPSQTNIQVCVRKRPLNKRGK